MSTANCKKKMLTWVCQFFEPLSIVPRVVLPSSNCNELCFFCFPLSGPCIFYLQNNESICWLTKISGTGKQILQSALFCFQYCYQPWSDIMAYTIVDLHEFPTIMNISLEGMWFSKEFSKKSLIHLPFWSHSIVDRWNVIF